MIFLPYSAFSQYKIKCHLSGLTFDEHSLFGIYEVILCMCVKSHVMLEKKFKVALSSRKYFRFLSPPPLSLRFTQFTIYRLQFKCLCCVRV